MRIRLLSDLHCEHHADEGPSFIKSLDPSGVDVLVLAGDIGVGRLMKTLLPLFDRQFPLATIVYVPGNHEFYGSDKGRTNAILRHAMEKTRVILLDNDIHELEDGRRILGTSLWFPETPNARRHSSTWSDFRCIQNLSSWVYEENRKAVRFLRSEMREGDIVTTHFCPSWLSSHPQFAGDVNNCFFICDLQELIEERKPALWMHGHTHESFDYLIGPTRVVCNPMGVATKTMNRHFDENLILSV